MITAAAASADELRPWRDIYRAEMNCQIIHDSLHSRHGWTRSYWLHVDGVPAGYGSIAIGGPWTGKPTVFEYFVLPKHRLKVFDLFEELLRAVSPVAIETQSNGCLLAKMLHVYARDVASESILFHDRVTTDLLPSGAKVRRVIDGDVPQVAEHELDFGAKWGVELDGKIVASGDILFHYNRPYGDIYMKVASSFRRRGLGSFLVQELKRICYEQGNVPAARCNPTNIGSRKTLQKAGFVPCGHILVGQLKTEAEVAPLSGSRYSSPLLPD